MSSGVASNKKVKSSKATAAPAASVDVEPQAADVAEAGNGSTFKRKLSALAATPCPDVIPSGRANDSISVYGTVIDIAVDKKNKPPKVTYSIAVERVLASSCKNSVQPVEGVAFCLPSKRLQASPDELARNSKAQGACVLDWSDDHRKANCLMPYLSVGLLQYADARDKRDGQEHEQITVGMSVQVTGVVSVFKSGCYEKTDATPLYMNAKNVQRTRKDQDVLPGQAAKLIIEAACTETAMAANALLLSMTSHGFFGFDSNDSALTAQASACQQQWTKFVEGTAQKLDFTLAAGAKSPGGPECVSAMRAHIDRIAQVSAADAASGTLLFETYLGKDCVTPYRAAIVQRGMCARKDAAAHECGYMCGGLDEPRAASLPKSFCEGTVGGVKVDGNAIIINFRLWFVFDKNAAIEAAKRGEQPVLTEKNAAALVKLSKRTFGPALVGTTVIAKADMVAAQVLCCCDMALYAPVFPRGMGDEQPMGHFASGTSGIDMINGITKCGVRVSKEWIDEKMLANQGELEEDVLCGLSLPLIQPADEDKELPKPPKMATHAYQALSESPFKLKNIKANEGQMLKFFVLYDGCMAAVADEPVLCTSTSSGEEHLDALGIAMDDSPSLEKFLLQSCVVYAVSVAAN